MSLPTTAPPTGPGTDGAVAGPADRFSRAGLDLHLDRIAALDARAEPEVSDIVIDGRLGASPWRAHVPSGLVLLALGTRIGLPDLLELPRDDAALVAEHLLGPAITSVERRFGRRFCIETLARAADMPASPVAEGQGAAYRLTVSALDTDFTVAIDTPAASRFGRLLAAAADPAGEASDGHATQPAEPLSSAGAGAPVLALGPLYLDIATLDAIQPGDVLELGAGETVTGGLFARGGVTPVEVAADTAIVAAAFDRAALGKTTAAQAKLWIECGTADAAEPPPMAGTRVAWTAFREDEAWLTLDGSRLRLARGRLVDTDGRIALRVEQARSGSWA